GTEAESKTFAADRYFTGGNALAGAVDFVKNGWVIPIKDAGIPVVKSGDFPARFVPGPIAVVQVAPWGIAYNSDLVKSANILKDRPDVLNSAFIGQLIVPDVRGSDSFPPFWAAILDKYGESFLTRIRDSQPRIYPSGVPATNA